MPLRDDTRYDILIAGASFAGLALARALAEGLGASARIGVVERAPELTFPRDSRAVTLSASSKRMLDALGAWRLVADEAQPIRRIEITDTSLDAGVRPVLLAYANEVEARDPASYVVPNAVLLGALAAEAGRAEGVAFILGAEVVGCAARDSAIDLHLGDGRALAASLLIAADGRRSALRDAAGVKTVSWPADQIGIVVRVAHERPHEGVAVQHFLPGGPFAFLPLRGERACVTWSERTGEARGALALDDQGFTEEVERRFGGRLGWVKLDGPRQSWPIEQTLARAYTAPRFAVAGDAAHSVHPIAGQGLNLALRDAAALAEVLVDGARLGLDLGDATQLDRYARWRRFDAASAALAFDGLNRLFSNDSMLLRAARQVGLKTVDALPGLKSWFVAEAAGLTGDLPRLLRGERV